MEEESKEERKPARKFRARKGSDAVKAIAESRMPCILRVKRKLDQQSLDQICKTAL